MDNAVESQSKSVAQGEAPQEWVPVEARGRRAGAQERKRGLRVYAYEATESGRVFRFRADLDRRWVIEYRLRPQAGAAVIAEMRIYPSPTWFESQVRQRRNGLDDPEKAYRQVRGRVPKGGVTSTLLRKISVPKHLELLREMDSEFRAWLAENIGETPRQRQRVTRYDDCFMARLARNYARFAPRGRVIQRLVGLYRGRFSATQLTELVRTARAAGYLTPTRRGLAGGFLTDKARAVLDGRKP